MPKQQKPISEQLREAIDKSELTRYQISQLSGVHQANLSRFVHRESTLSLDSVDRIAKALGLKLVSTAMPKRK